jgi:hypothetical protein
VFAIANIGHLKVIMKGKVWLEVLFLTDAVLKEACTTNSYEDAHR